MTSGITAEDIVRLFEEDVRARKRLAELLVSEPDVRLAIINAVLRDVATKQDLREAVRELREYVDARIRELREYVREYVDARIGSIERQLEELRSEVRELRERLWWVVATVILGWLAVVVEQLLLYTLRGG